MSSLLCSSSPHTAAHNAAPTSHPIYVHLLRDSTPQRHSQPQHYLGACATSLVHGTTPHRPPQLDLKSTWKLLEYNLVEAHCYGIGRAGLLLGNHVAVKTDWNVKRCIVQHCNWQRPPSRSKYFTFQCVPTATWLRLLSSCPTLLGYSCSFMFQYNLLLAMPPNLLERELKMHRMNLTPAQKSYS